MQKSSLTTALVPAELALPVGNLDSYIRRVNQLPLLSLEEERSLAFRFFEKQDLEAARKIILYHLRFVVKVARSYMGYGLTLADLIQEGNIGLMKALRRFDPKKGVRFVSFAIHWIKAEINEYVIKNFRIVKIATTKAQRKLFFKLRNTKKHLGWLKGKEVQEVAKQFNVKSETVSDMEARLSQKSDIAFETDNSDEEDHHYTLAPEDYLTASIASDPAVLLDERDREQTIQQLKDAFKKLDKRSQMIISRRFSDKKTTLEELGALFDVTPERIRQLEQQALSKLRSYLS